MRNKGTEQIPMNFVIILAMFAIGAGLMLLLMGRWLDLTGLKYELVTQRNALDLSQLIVSSSPIVKRDSSGEPIKLILDSVELDNYGNNANRGTENPSEQRENWEKCCDFLDFDYNLTIHKFKKEGDDLVVDRSWSISNLIFDPTSDCYIPRIMGIGDLPVAIQENGEMHPGTAILTMTRTPLSDLSFWLSQSFVRASWEDYWKIFPSRGDERYDLTIPLDPEIECIKIFSIGEENYQRVCIYLREDRCSGELGCKNHMTPEDCSKETGCHWVDWTESACKNFVYESTSDSGEPVTFVKNNDNMMGDGCFNVDLTVERNKVTISCPGKNRNNEWC